MRLWRKLFEKLLEQRPFELAPNWKEKIISFEIILVLFIFILFCKNYFKVHGNLTKFPLFFEMEKSRHVLKKIWFTRQI